MWFATELLKHIFRAKDRCVFYLCLLIINTKVIIKANAMIVTPIKE